MGVGAMIQIYSPNNTDFASNGNAVLMRVVAQLEATINGPWPYTLEHPIDSMGRWKYIEPNAIIKAPSFNGEQLFRVKNVEKDETLITAEAEPIFLDAKDEIFLKDVRITNKNCSQALSTILAGSRFSGQSNITKKAGAYYVYKNGLEAINGGDENALIARWGGEILFDNYTIIVNNKIGEDRGIEVRYGKNIPANGFSEEIDIRSIATRVYPTSYNGYRLSGNGYVDSPLINNYPIKHVATIQYSNVKMAEDAQEGDAEKGIIICNNQRELDAALRAQVMADFNAGLDKPAVLIAADMVLLQDVIGYEDYRNLLQVELGDTIHCYHNKLGIITDARVTTLVYDSLREIVTDVKLTSGGSEYNYFNDVTLAVKETSQLFGKGANGTFSIGDKTIYIDKGVITSIV